MEGISDSFSMAVFRLPFVAVTSAGQYSNKTGTAMAITKPVVIITMKIKLKLQ
jgi:hypothetical protein